jgi:hypothetical protein
MATDNWFLKEQIIRETVRGGPAYYRPSRLQINPLARFRIERAEEQAKVRGRVVCIKLPWVFAIIRLPRWSRVGTPLE